MSFFDKVTWRQWLLIVYGFFGLELNNKKIETGKDDKEIFTDGAFGDSDNPPLSPSPDSTLAEVPST